MNNIIRTAAILGLLALLNAAFMPNPLKKHTLLAAAPEGKLVIDKNFIAYLNKQIALDVLDDIYLFADTVEIAASDTIRHVNLLIYTNYFKGKKLTLISKGQGKKGQNAVIYAKKVESADFNLPGNHGAKGTKGGAGKDGERPLEEGSLISRGTRGEPGTKGAKGGDGGNLTFYALHTNYTPTFNAKGGNGGAGGEGGQGGLTYFREISKIINPGKPNQVIIYGATQSRREPNGAAGAVGEKGRDGATEKNVLTDTKFNQAASTAYVGDWKDIRKNGWIVVFRNKTL